MMTSNNFAEWIIISKEKIFNKEVIFVIDYESKYLQINDNLNISVVLDRWISNFWEPQLVILHKADISELDTEKYTQTKFSNTEEHPYIAKFYCSIANNGIQKIFDFENHINEDYRQLFVCDDILKVHKNTANVCPTGLNTAEQYNWYRKKAEYINEKDKKIIAKSFSQINTDWHIDSNVLAQVKSFIKN